jgi:hypothetical protein
MDRRDLLLESTEGEKITPEEESRLRKAAEIGGMYLSLTSTAGWKHAMNEYISKQISQDRYLTAKTEELADIRAAQKALIDFLHYVKSNIDAGEKAYKRLQKESTK